MKAQAKYLQLLERELEYLRDLLGQARKDVEFYRGKVERLELSLREAGVPVAAPDLPAGKSLAQTVAELKKLPSGRVPFSELKRRWSAMSEKEQEKALQDGWNLDQEVKEESNEGK